MIVWVSSGVYDDDHDIVDSELYIDVPFNFLLIMMLYIVR